jgi:hypothetical protein
MSGDLVSGTVDPATLYTKQQCIGRSTPLYKRTMNWIADRVPQAEVVLERCTKGMSQLTNLLSKEANSG